MHSGGFASWSQDTTSTHLKPPRPTEVLESNYLALWPPSHISDSPVLLTHWGRKDLSLPAPSPHEGIAAEADCTASRWAQLPAR